MTTAIFSSVPEMLEERARTNPDQEIIGVPDRSFGFTRYTYRQLNEYSDNLAHYYASTHLPARSQNDTTTHLVCAILAPSGFDYVVNEIALVKLGYCALFLSTNNSVPALAHLLKATSTTKIVVHPDFKSAAEEAISLAKENGMAVDCGIVDIADHSVWELATPLEPYIRALSPEQESTLPVFCVHSSGSTGFPKPIYITNKASCHNFGTGGFGLTAFTTLPLFHNHGHSCLWRAICGRTSICLYPSEIPLTTPNVIAALAKAGPVEGLYIVPYVLKLLAESDDGIELLKSFRLVTYGGAACPDELGDKLVREHGVRLVGHYGSTEVGQLATSMRDFDTDPWWNYVRFAGPHAKRNLGDYLLLESRGDDLIEVIVKDGWPGKVMSNLPNNDYGTKDLFVAHPSIEGAYKFKGRLDDTLVQVNGEKTNPVPIELTLKGESPYISEAIVFGGGQPHIGAIILPTDIAKDLTPAQLFPLIWPTVELANKDAPSHSQLLPEMLIYLQHDTQIPRADKGSIIRPRVYAQFEREINELYARYETGEAVVPGRETTKKTLQGAELSDFITRSIAKVVGAKPESLDEKADLFDFGIDSLQASRIRNILQQNLELNGRRMAGNMVFEHPTVEQLTKYLTRLQQSGDEDTGSDTAHQNVQVGKMTELLERYSKFVERPPTTATPLAPTRQTYLLTGGTGSLGAHLIHTVLQRNDTEAVICLVRGRDHKEARGRIISSLATRALPTYDDEARLLVYAADLADAKLGLADDVYQDLQGKVTRVIHNGWTVNFTLNVESFEKGNILPAYNLLNFAITARDGRSADFYFTSSVSAVAAHQGRVIKETVSSNPLDAQAMGYARSKWVTENMVARAASTRGIRACSFRVGQMVGDTLNGVWNETEAISLLIKSSQTIGSMPDLKETLSWLPVDLAAAACIEISSSSAATDPGVWHILNSSTATTWETVHAALRQAGIEFDVIPRRQWVAKLRDSDSNLERNPTYKLVDFFAAKYDNDLDGRRAEYLTEETSKVSSVIASRPRVDESVMGKFIAAWRRSGFLV